LLREYLFLGLDLIFQEFLKSTYGYFDDIKLIGLMKMLGFIFALIFAYIFIFNKFLDQLKREIWQTKGMLNMIPTKLLLKHPKLKEQFLKQQI
jgi:hypothetical protein